MKHAIKWMHNPLLKNSVLIGATSVLLASGAVFALWLSIETLSYLDSIKA